MSGISIRKLSLLNFEKIFSSQGRGNIFLSIFISWGAFHFIRKSFSALIPCLKTDLGLSLSQIGFLSSCFYIVYSLSKLFCGYLVDRLNARLLISLSLALSGICNIMLSFFSSMVSMAVFLAISAFFQAFSWPACARLLTFWCKNKERGKWWGLCSIGQNVGAAFAPLLMGFSSVYLGWQWAMFLSGAIGVCLGLLMIITLRDRPSSSPELLQDDNYDTGELLSDLSSKSFLFVIHNHILKNMPLVIFSMSGLFLYVTRTAVNDWIPLYLMEEKHYQSLIVANGTIAWFECGGLLGAVLACWASDFIFKANRLLATLSFCTALFFTIIFFSTIPTNSVMVDSLFMAAIGFLVFGIQSIFGLATTEMVLKWYAGTANSFGSFVSNLGAAISALPLAIIVEAYGWNGFFYTITGCAFLSVIFVTVAWNLTTSQVPRNA